MKNKKKQNKTKKNKTKNKTKQNKTDFLKFSSKQNLITNFLEHLLMIIYCAKKFQNNGNGKKSHTSRLIPFCFVLFCFYYRFLDDLFFRSWSSIHK